MHGPAPRRRVPVTVGLCTQPWPEAEGASHRRRVRDTSPDSESTPSQRRHGDGQRGLSGRASHRADATTTAHPSHLRHRAGRQPPRGRRRLFGAGPGGPLLATLHHTTKAGIIQVPRCRDARKASPVRVMETERYVGGPAPRSESAPGAPSPGTPRPTGPKPQLRAGSGVRPRTRTPPLPGPDGPGRRADRDRLTD